jgi:hypothetical protein
MVKLRKQKINSFNEFVQFIEELRCAIKGPIWYRGCGRSSYKLTPGLFRHSGLDGIEQHMTLENQLMTRFRQRSIPFHSRNLEDDWELLFFMQHYGVPTRLLDWTENPFLGLFFAAMYAPCSIGSRGNLKFECESAVWILDPIKWNRHALKFKSFQGEIITPLDADLNPFKPTLECEHMNNHPVAIFGAHNSQRIVAQRGVFMVFGKDLTSMERMFERDGFPENCLIKLTLSKGALPKVQKALKDHGITDSVVFPELEGLAREIKREFGFEV